MIIHSVGVLDQCIQYLGKLILIAILYSLVNQDSCMTLRGSPPTRPKYENFPRRLADYCQTLLSHR